MDALTARVIEDTRIGRRFRVKFESEHKNMVGVCVEVNRDPVSNETRWLRLELPCGCKCAYAPGDLSAMALAAAA